MTNNLFNTTNELIRETVIEYFRPITGLRKWFKTNFVSPFYVPYKSLNYIPKDKAVTANNRYCTSYNINPYLKDLILDEYKLSKIEGLNVNSKMIYSYYFGDSPSLINLAFFEKERIVTEKFVSQFDSIIKDNERLEGRQIKVLRIIFAHEFTSDLYTSGLLRDIHIEQLREVASAVDHVRYHQDLLKQLKHKEVNSFVKDVINIYSALFKILMFNFSVRDEETRYGVMPTSQRVNVTPYYLSLTENSSGIEDILIAQESV